MPVPCFCCLFVSEKLFGELSRNQLEIYVNYFHKEIKTEPGGELQGAHTSALPGAHLVPSDVFSSYPFAYKLTSTRKPLIPNHILQKTSEAAAVVNPRLGGF